jgi:GTPase SAR1 family protein
MTDSADMELPSLKALQTGEQMELLNIVDSLRAEGLGEITALPQLIVCGDQSSGKSSVLEAISGIPFPRKENTCTRFATEVILRRSPESRISVSVVPSRDRKQADREKLLKFRHQLSTPDDFPDLFDKAKDAMLNVPGKSFSKDILRIEFCGPSQPQLTLVDLPGLIHSHIEAEQQTPEDVKLVTELVSDYLKSPRSIILAIVSAKYDINVQVILNRAREVDPQGIRTLGIITKPDTLVKGSESEDSFVKLARNERVKFRLGWHVVKNLDSAHKESLKSTLETRNTEEKAFFKGSNFKSLPSQNVGIESLRTQLSKILFNQIRLELPRLVDDIEQRILTARASKDKLGPSRTSIDDQRSFLIQLSQTFQTICQAAVRGDYDNDFFHSDELREKRLFQSDELSERRLCAILMDKHFGFADNLLKKGCQWTIGERSFDAVGFTFDTKRRTREEAIADACRLLKRSRGREVKTPLLYAQKQSYVDSNANKFGYSCLVFRIHSWWENFSVNIAAHGIHLLGCILRIPGKLRTDFLTLCSST